MRNWSKLGRIIGIASCQSAHEMLYAFEGFLSCSVETAKKAFVVRIGRFLNFSVNSSCKVWPSASSGCFVKSEISLTRLEIK